jgi:hypothetical protein
MVFAPSSASATSELEDAGDSVCAKARWPGDSHRLKITKIAVILKAWNNVPQPPY